VRRKALLGLALLLALPTVAAEPAPIKIRTITAFVPLQASTAERTFRETGAFLRQARQRFEAAGWEVQSLRLATPPLDVYINDVPASDRLAFLLRLDALAAELGLELSLGPARFRRGRDAATEDLLVELLTRSRNANASAEILPEKPETLAAAARIIQRLGEVKAAEPPSFRFAAAAECPPGIPFFPVAYAGGRAREFALGLQSANFLLHGFSAGPNRENRDRVELNFAHRLRELEVLAQQVAREQRWNFLGIDVSPAPLGEESIAAVLEILSGGPIGSPATVHAVAELTAMLRRLPVRQTGFSGLMLPVLEDKVLAQRAAEGRLRLHTLLVYSAVSGTGLDVVPLPADTDEERLVRILQDVAALATKLRKPLTARLLLVPGKRAGEMTEFDSPWLTNTRVMSLE